MKTSNVSRRNSTQISRSWLRRYSSIEPAKTWRNGVHRHILTILAVYTLLYLIAVNSIYIANKSYETSINIKVRRVKGKSNHYVKDFIRAVAEEANIQRTQTFANLSKHTDILKLDNKSPERQSDIDDFDEHHLDEEPDSDVKDIDQPKLVESGNKPFMYDHPVLRRIDGLAVFYISAVADIYSRNPNASSFQNSLMTPTSVYFLRPLTASIVTSQFGTITINGWEFHSHVKARYNCCYRYDQKVLGNDVLQKSRAIEDLSKSENNEDHVTVKESPMTWKNVWNIHKLKIMKASQFVCPLVPLINDKGTNIFPTKVALSNKQTCANWKTLKYLDIDNQTIINKDSIAVCPKLVYGNYSAHRLIEWFEFNKQMGVDKIMLFTYNVVKEVQIVLNHYVKEGLLITKEFDIPSKTTFKRKPGDKHMMAFQDEQVIVFDCIERFNGFRFVAILDLDEFLIPANGCSTWRTMLNNLQNDHKNASGFSFHTQIFTLDWGISNPKGKLFVTKYTKRTTTMWDRKKNIIIPERIQRGKVWTHAFASSDGYEPVKIPTKFANIFHYRKCRQHWIRSHTCMKGRHKIIDNTMVLTMQKIEDNIIKLKHILLKR